MTQRILRNNPATLSAVFYNDEAPVSADGPVSVTVTNAAGAVIAGPTNATVTGTTTYTFTLPAQAVLNDLTATWTGTFATLPRTVTTEAAVVGDHYVSLGELRTVRNLEDTVKFPSSVLRRGREWFEEKFEDFTGVAWVPQYRRAVLSSGWSMDGSLLLPDMYVRTVRSLSYTTTSGTTTAFTADELADLDVYDSGLVARRTLTYWYAGTSLITVEYEHGKNRPPADVVEISKIAIADHILGNNSGNRQFSVATEAGIVRSSTPGPNTPFGIPEVDEVAARRCERVPATT